MPMNAAAPLTDVTAAFVGSGFMTSVHARAARASGARLLGVASRTVRGAETARDAMGVELAYGSVSEMLADERVEVVHVCTPNLTHAGIAMAALQAGKAVICEKPLATSVLDAGRLARTAAQSGVAATVPFVYRYHPMVRHARARVQQGDTGRLFSIQGAYLQDWLADPADDDWRVNPEHGGPSRAFADIGSHLVDLIEFVTSDKIERLVAKARTVHSDRVSNKRISTEDLATVVFETATGVVGTLHVSQVSLGRKNALRFEIAGENETLVFDQESPEFLKIGTVDGFLTTARSDRLMPDAARLSRVPAGHPQGYQDAFNAFVSDSYAAVRGGSPDGLPTFDDGLRAVTLTDAVLRSHRTDRWVDTTNHQLAASSL